MELRWSAFFDKLIWPGRHDRRGAVAMTCQLWRRRQRTRRQLETLDGHRLADVGLTEKTRQAECAKWFWRA